MTRPTHMAPDGTICFPDGVAGATALPVGYWGGIDLADARRNAWARVKALRAARYDAGFTVEGVGTFQSDAAAREKLTAAAIAAISATLAAQPFSIDWTLADNSSATLNGPALIAVFVAMVQEAGAIHARSRVLFDAIDAAEDMAAVGAIDIAADWP